jgi:gliding motility-associated-like protein
VEPVPKPIADLGEDKQLCEGETAILESLNGPFVYLWNGEDGGATFEVSSEGVYTLQVSNQCGTVQDEVLVEVFPVPEVDLGEDQVITEGETIELDGGEGHDMYLWQDGSGGRFFTVSYDDIDADDPFYFVEVTDGPCKNSDTTEVILFSVKIPNVFTPNGDGYNDDFLPMESGWSGVTKHHIDIFNRWGEKVWESNNFESGWDGKRNGRPVASGTYFWVLEVFYGTDQVKQTLKGTVTILDSD